MPLTKKWSERLYCCSNAYLGTPRVRMDCPSDVIIDAVETRWPLSQKFHFDFCHFKSVMDFVIEHLKKKKSPSGRTMRDKLMLSKLAHTSCTSSSSSWEKGFLSQVLFTAGSVAMETETSPPRITGTVKAAACNLRIWLRFNYKCVVLFFSFAFYNSLPS